MADEIEQENAGEEKASKTDDAASSHFFLDKAGGFAHEELDDGAARANGRVEKEAISHSTAPGSATSNKVLFRKDWPPARIISAVSR